MSALTFASLFAGFIVLLSRLRRPRPAPTAEAVALARCLTRATR